MISFREYKLDQHDRGALLERGHQLIHAGIKTKGQNSQNSLLFGDPEIG